MFPHQWLFALCSNVLIICITILREYFLRYIFNIINSLMMIKCGSIFGNRFSLFWHMSLGLLRAKIHRPSKTIQSFKKITKTAKSFMVILAILSIFGNQFSLFWHMSLGLSRAKIHRPSKTIQSFKKITKITKIAKSFMVILAILSILSRYFFQHYEYRDRKGRRKGDEKVTPGFRERDRVK